MSSELSPDRFRPELGRVPARVTHALFAETGWVSSDDPAIVTALAAASPNTRVAWACDWAVFRTWALGRAAHWMPAEGERLRLPVLPVLLVRFIEDMRSGYPGSAPRAITTVRRYLSTVGTLHRLLDCPDPTKAAIVRNTLKAHTRGSGGPAQAAPVRWADVSAMIERLPDDLRGLRDKTLIAVAHNALARRSELVALDVGDVEFLADGAALVALRPTKASVAGEVDPRYLSPVVAGLVRTWLARSGLSEGPLFVAVNRQGEARRSNGGRGLQRALLPYGRRLNDQEVNVIVKLAMAQLALARGEWVLAGDSPRARRREMLAAARPYSGHSMRVGAAQDMAAAGVSTAAILQAGGWADERMVKRYLRKLGALEGGMAQLFRST